MLLELSSLFVCVYRTIYTRYILFNKNNKNFSNPKDFLIDILTTQLWQIVEPAPTLFLEFVLIFVVLKFN